MDKLLGKMMIDINKEKIQILMVVGIVKNVYLDEKD